MLSRLVRSFRPSASQIVISLLIAGLGWLSGGALSRVDQDLRIMYTEYTLGAADLAHISADVMRYRNTIIRAVEADSKRDFERITESLPGQRARVQLAVDRYAAAGLRVSRSGRSEPEDIEAVRKSLDQYFSAASTTIDLLSRVWNAPSQTERDRLRRLAEEHAADNAGPKMIQVSLALDRLLDTVADVAKDMRDEGTKAIQSTSIMLVVGSFFIALLNLFFTKPRSSGRSAAGSSPEPTPASLDTAQRQSSPPSEILSVRSLQ
ncbi:MAG TPA: Tar ligand binding domain-containing protein [Nitrospira sp.]|nr:Tar ligand binding domain-containing protein [Nitrospira sp.]